MDTKTETIRVDGLFADVKCTLIFNGMEFTSGGAFLGVDNHGRMGGLLYAYEEEGMVGNWDGSIKINAVFGRTWRSNFGDERQVVHFEYADRKFWGIYYKSRSDIIRVKEVRNV